MPHAGTVAVIRQVTFASDHYAGAREDAHLEAGEHSLATACSVWAGEVAAIVLGIEGALEREAES
jgi:hypothetical protein